MFIFVITENTLYDFNNSPIFYRLRFAKRAVFYERKRLFAAGNNSG